MGKRTAEEEPVQVKRQRELLLLPRATTRYARSYVHDSSVTCVATCSSGIVVTGTQSGTVVFWNKNGGTLDLLKEFKAHPGNAISCLVFTDDGSRLASVARDDPAVKVYDVKMLDMAQVVTLDFCASTACWCKAQNSYRLIACQDTKVHVIDPDDNDVSYLSVDLHRAPITCVAYNWNFAFAISVDSRGVIEFWTPTPQFSPPANAAFNFKLETDLFDLTKNKVCCDSVVFSNGGDQFATVSEDEVRVWGALSGRIARRHALKVSDACFDSLDTALVCGSDSGIKVVSPGANVQTIGADDAANYSFAQVHVLADDITNYSTDMIASENAILQNRLERSPLVVCAAKGCPRLFVFGGDDSSETDRDQPVSNGSEACARPSQLISEFDGVTLQTSLGDIHIKLFPKQAPQTVENFLRLCQRLYYNLTIFHRVIKKFMLQAGDPLGDGTGGESAYGGYIRDEFSPNLRHSKPFMVSMANSGPNTNGLQFFITTEATPWLDGKHSIFGEVTGGLDVVRMIEALEVDKNDRPVEQVVILSTTATKGQDK